MHTKPFSPWPMGCQLTLHGPPQASVCSRITSDFRVRNVPRPGWSWEAAVESSCRESQPWTFFNYDENVSLFLFWLE